MRQALKDCKPVFKKEWKVQIHKNIHVAVQNWTSIVSAIT